MSASLYEFACSCRLILVVAGLWASGQPEVREGLSTCPQPLLIAHWDYLPASRTLVRRKLKSKGSLTGFSNTRLWANVS